MDKSRRGRPKNNPAANVSELVTFRLTESERAQCEQAAEKANVSLRAWLRNRVAKAAKRESNKN